MRTVAVYAHEDGFSLHRFKADESDQVGRGRTSIVAYLDIDDILRVAVEAGADASIPAMVSCRRTRSSPRPAPPPASNSSGLLKSLPR